MAGSSNRSPSPLSAKPIPPHPRTIENTNSTARRSFNGNPFSRPSALSTHRGFNPVTPANSPADSAKRVSSSGKEGGFEEKENEQKAVKLRSPAAKGSKNFMSPTISASSKTAPSPKKKILVERNDPLRTSISLSDGKATFFNASSENYDVGFEHSNNTVKSMEKTEILLEPKEENILVEEQGLTPVAKTPKKVTFLEVPLPSESLSDTVTMDSDFCNDEPILVSTLIAPLDADPSLPPYDPKTNYLSPRPQFLHYKPNPRIEVLLNKEKRLDVVGGAKSLDDSFLSEFILSDNISDTEDSESSQTAEESPKESDGSSSEEMLLEATVDQEEEEPKIPEPAAEEIAEAKMRTKPRSSVISKFFSSLLLLLIALVSISVTDSPLLTTTPGSIDLRFSNLSIPSDIPVLVKASSYFKQFSGEAISYFSKLIYDLGSIPSDIPVHPLKFMNLTDVQDSSIDHWYLKRGTGSEELDKGLKLVELEEDEESETESNEEEVQMEADFDDDGNQDEIEGAHELEIEEASAILLDEGNEADSSKNDQEQEQHDLDTEEVSIVLVAEGNESISPLVADSSIDHWYLKRGTGSEELDKGLKLVELEEDEESETESNEEEVQMEADFDDDGNQDEIEGAHELEIEEASAILLDEGNEADSSKNDQEQEQHDLDTEEVSIVLVAEGNESISPLVADSSIDHWYLKRGTGSEELDKGLKLVELEEDEESETESNEEEVQMEADFDDDGNQDEIEGAHELEIEEASAILLDEGNEADSSKNDQEQEQHDLDTEEVSIVLVAEGNESISSEGDLDQGEHELAGTESFNVDNDASSDAVVESVNVNPESLVKDDSSGEDAQPLEAVQSPIYDRLGDNVQILGISSVILSVLATVVIYLKTKTNKTLQPVVYSDHIVKEKHSSQNWPTEVDVMGESCPSEMSSFQISSSYSEKYPKSANDEAQSMEKKPRKSNRRESLAASEYSLGSPSYGSFTTYERIPIKHVSGGEEIITPVRRSSRIRSHVTSP